MAEFCGAEFAAHPVWPWLTATCTLPPSHDGEHDNVLPKAGGQ